MCSDYQFAFAMSIQQES